MSAPAKNMAAALPGRNMAAALPGQNMAAALPGLNMAAAVPGLNMAAALPGLNMAAALPGLNMAAAVPGLGPAAALPAPGTGAGYPSGHGFIGGYGVAARSDYATPAALGPLPWALDFSYGSGWEPFPHTRWLDPTAGDPVPQWEPGDWDPGLRFWTLPFDTQLTEWLQDLDLASPAVMAAREFAACFAQWRAAPPGAQADAPPGQALPPEQQPSPLQQAAMADGVTDWHLPQAHPDAAQRQRARNAIEQDLCELQDLMRDERERYLAEAHAQSSAVGSFFVHLIGFDPAARPHTLLLMDAASAIANLVKMHYKATYRRLRPSTLCPGLVPPWGPPQHPSFPSGHALVAHLTALLLLEIEPLAQRLGVFDAGQPVGRRPALNEFIGTPDAPEGAAAAGDGADAAALRPPCPHGADMHSPMLWLAWRLARNRERIGVHYPSDSRASRRLAAALWASIRGGSAQERVYRGPDGRSLCSLPAISVPTLQGLIRRAQAEWPAPMALAPRAD